jgi:hypothetical protein
VNIIEATGGRENYMMWRFPEILGKFEITPDDSRRVNDTH